MNSAKTNLKNTRSWMRQRALRDWLRSNLDLGLNQWESFGDEYPKIKVGHFVNGKDCNGAYESIDVFVVLADFRQIYTFKALFDDLFFEKKSASQGLKGA